MPMVILDALKCTKKSDDAGKEDEIYLKINVDTIGSRLPEMGEWDMRSEQKQPIDHRYAFQRELTVTVMEHDPASDDVIGKFTWLAGAQSPGSPLVLTGHKSLYELYFKYAA